MKRILPLLGCVVVAACQHDTVPTSPDATPPALSVQGAGQTAEPVVPGRVLAKFQPGASVGAVAAAYGLSIAGRGYADAFVILQGAAVGSERAAAARLAADGRVVFAEPDYRRRFNAIDSRLWAFYNPGGLTISFTQGASKGSVVSSYLSKNDADEDNVESYAAGGSDVVISSIDTGVEFSHPEFSGGTLIPGQDWYSGDNDPSDQAGHGTHTTGTMAGHTVGVAGVSGAGPHVKVLVQRVCGQQFCDTSAIANAIRAAADYPNLVAMNLSLGGSSESSAEADAIAYATSKNVLVIASAGNGGTSTVECPACDPNAISVAASNWLDEHTYYTNWGSGLDLTAPGGEMYSNTTEESGIYSSYIGGGYAYLQGTSMAAPQVTGTAAIVASKLGLRGAPLRSRLESTADDLGSGGYDTNFGHGRLNSYRAVTGSTPPGEPTGGGSTLAAAFTFSCRGGATCSFDGSSSTAATSYSWNFGDGGSATGAQATHTFNVGTWTVTLTVGDGSSTAATSKSVSCVVKGPKVRCG
jgi:serine protease